MKHRLGVKVRVHEFIEFGAGGSAANVLTRLQDDADVRRAVAAAEVILVYGNPSGSGVPTDTEDVCLSTSRAKRQPPGLLSRADLRPYRALLMKIYRTVFDLRAGRPTVVRAMDLYNPTISDWRAAGIAPECTANWEAVSTAAREVAGQNDVPFASMYDAFNGPGHDKDPRARGLVLAPGGIHTTSKGQALMTATLDALGYAPLAG
jgi:hypothetical protein